VGHKSLITLKRKDMKRIKLVFIALLVALGCLGPMVGCKKYNEYPSRTAQVSFPTITLNGNGDTTLSNGTAWNDPGAKWSDAVTGETGTVYAQKINTGIDSAYLLIYTATNKNGFQSFASRRLGVTNYNGPLTIAGLYNAGSIAIVPTTRALFAINSADGFSAADSSAIVIKTDGTLSVGTVGTYVTGTNGVPLTETFTGTQVVFQAPFIYTGTPPRLTAEPAVIIQYNANITNVPAIPITLQQDLQ
jgi:hypothetical protein